MDNSIRSRTRPYIHQFFPIPLHAWIFRICTGPSHSRLVLSSQLKQKWSQARDEYERSKGIAVIKFTFLEVYSRVHNAALTLENIKTVFRKTAVIPLNQNFVTEQMMAPSSLNGDSNSQASQDLSNQFQLEN